MTEQTVRDDVNRGRGFNMETFPMIVAHLRRSLSETFQARASEWALAIVIFNWALVLFLNEDLFATGASYTAMDDLLSQPAWAWLCLAIGGGRIAVLAINGAWRRSPHLRALTAFLSCFFWMQATLGFLESGTGSTGLAVYPVLLLLDSYNVIRAMGEAGLADDHYKRAAGRNGHHT